MKLSRHSPAPAWVGGPGPTPPPGPLSLSTKRLLTSVPGLTQGTAGCLPVLSSKQVGTHLPRNDACSAGSAPQDEGELADLGQACGHDPLDVLAGLRQEERQDQRRQDKLQEACVSAHPGPVAERRGQGRPREALQCTGANHNSVCGKTPERLRQHRGAGSPPENKAFPQTKVTTLNTT